MNNGISGYGSRYISGYSPVESRTEAPSRPDAQTESRTAAPESTPLHPELSEAESGMIRKYFPESENLALRLYGPGRDSRTVNPNGVGRRIDVRG